MRISNAPKHRRELAIGSVLAAAVALLAPAARSQTAGASESPPRPEHALAARRDPPRDPPRPNDEANRRQHLHGYFLRVGLGVGALRNHVAQAYTFGGGAEGASTGLGMSAELTLTAPVSASWTVGGGAWSSFVLGSADTAAGEPDIPDELQQPVNLTLVGPVAEWYFARELGLHTDMSLGLAVLHTEGERDSADRSTFGPGVAIGLGGELWVDENTGLGAALRVTAAMSQQSRRGALYQHFVLAPSLLLTFCMNG